MKWCDGQIVSLQDLQEGAKQSGSMQIGNAMFRIGDAMEIWFFDDDSLAVRFECWIAGFEIIAGKPPMPRLAVQIADSPYYAILNHGMGLLCQQGEIGEEQIDSLKEHHKAGGMAAVLAKLQMDARARQGGESDPVMRPRPHGNMNFSQTRAPESVSAKPFSDPPAPRRGHLKVVAKAGLASNPQTPGESDGQRSEEAAPQAGGANGEAAGPTVTPPLSS